MTDYKRAYYFANKERILKRVRAWRMANPEKARAYQRKYDGANKEKRDAYYWQNRQRILANVKNNTERNAGLILLKRRIWVGEVKNEAIPPWLSEEQKEAIQWFYDEARRLTKETGIRHVVDHIRPLNGVHSCGLHVPWNLQVLTDSENKKKYHREDKGNY